MARQQRKKEARLPSKTKLDKVKNEVNSAELQVKELAKVKESIELSIKSKQKELKEIENKALQASERLQNLEGEVSDTLGKKNALDKNVRLNNENLEKERESLSSEISKLETLILDLKEQKSKLMVENDDLIDGNNILVLEIKKNEEEKGRLSKEIAELLAEIEKYKKQIGVLCYELENKKINLGKALENEQKRLEEGIDGLKREYAGLQKDYANLRKEFSKLCEDNEVEVSKIEKERERIKKERENLLNKFKDLGMIEIHLDKKAKRIESMIKKAKIDKYLKDNIKL